VLQDSDDFLPLQDEGDDLYLRPALGTLQGVDFIDLINELRPGPVTGFFVRGIIHDNERLRDFQSQFLSLAAGGIGVMPVIANECFIMSGNMETNTVQELDGVQNLEIPFFALVQVRLVHHAARLLDIPDLFRRK
jgi:hypothetical protein